MSYPVSSSQYVPTGNGGVVGPGDGASGADSPPPHAVSAPINAAAATLLMSLIRSIAPDHEKVVRKV
jgi:hypothetical protein